MLMFKNRHIINYGELVGKLAWDGNKWKHHSRATNYLSQQPNSRLSKIWNFENFNFKKNSISSWNQFKMRNILNSNLYQLHVGRMLFYLDSSVWLLNLMSLKIDSKTKLYFEPGLKLGAESSAWNSASVSLNSAAEQ